MTIAELTTWQRQHVGDSPCVLLPGHYLLLRDQTLQERRETLRLLRQLRGTVTDTTMKQARNN